VNDRRVWAAIVVLVVAFGALPPLFSHDVFSYVDYARLGALHGLDPYIHPPAAEPFDPAYADVTWIDATSAYGPLFTLLTYPLAWLPVGAAVAALKAATAASVLAIAFIVARIAPARGVNPIGAAAFVALNPVVILQLVGGGHNDAIAMLAATIGVAAALSARPAASGAAFVAALAIKPPAALTAPFALLGARIRDSPHQSVVNVGCASALTLTAEPNGFVSTRPYRDFFLGAVVTGLVLGFAAYAAFGWNWLDAIGLAGENQGRTTHMSIPLTTARLSGLDPTAIRAAALALFGAATAYLLIRTWQGHDWVRNAAWAALALLLATAWLLPWYLIWALPLVALSRDRPLQLLTLALTAFQLFARVPL
jgi:alpha-1,6-mannosyltransferase